MDVLFYEEHIRDLGLCTFGLEGYRGNGGQKVWNENAQNGFTLGTFFAFALQTLSQKVDFDLFHMIFWLFWFLVM